MRSINWAPVIQWQVPYLKRKYKLFLKKWINAPLTIPCTPECHTQLLKCNGTQGNAVPSPLIYGSKRSPTSDCYNARKKHPTMDRGTVPPPHIFHFNHWATPEYTPVYEIISPVVRGQACGRGVTRWWWQPWRWWCLPPGAPRSVPTSCDVIVAWTRAGRGSAARSASAPARVAVSALRTCRTCSGKSPAQVYTQHRHHCISRTHVETFKKDF